MARYVYDIECNGFLDQVTTLHSLVLKDVDTKELYSFHGSTLPEGLELLKAADQRIGHNIIKFDDAVLNKLYPDLNLDPHKAYDTLVLSRLIYADLFTPDVAVRMPNGLAGSHGLEAWGYRLGSNKMDYNLGFDAWNPTMQEYCENDVEVNFLLYLKFVALNYSPTAIELEHKLAVLAAKMERNGFPFDTDKASKLYSQLAGERAIIKDGLQGLFKPWQEVDKVFTPKRDNGPLGYRKGVPVTKYKTVSFNPGSRQHIAKNLIQKYGWKPSEFTPTGQAKIDETILGSLPYPEAQKLARYFMLEKRIGQIAEGDNAWLKLETGGKIHASYNTNGAVTGRPSCSYPNLQQVPSVSSPFGAECRECFYAPPGWKMLGADMSGLELRCLAHYMSAWDGGKYADTVVNGDVHSINQEAAGLPTRDNAKTFIYAFLYGAGDAKIGKIVGGTARDGQLLKESFLAKTPALKGLKNYVGQAQKKGYLKALDGRHISIRSEHAALNSLLQSAGAILCKKWLVLIDKELRAKGFKHGWDGDYVFLAWIHDEVQIAIKPELEEVIGSICIEMAGAAGEAFDFKCPTTAEYKVGANWAETH